MRLLSRLVVALLSLLWTVAVATGGTAPAQASQPDYTYTAQFVPAAHACDHVERGPSLDGITTGALTDQRSVSGGSHGSATRPLTSPTAVTYTYNGATRLSAALARSAVDEAYDYTDYDSPERPAHVVSIDATSEEPDWLTKGDRVVVDHARVAAKTVDNILPTPQVGSTKLQNLVGNLYKGTTNPNRVGNGTTMDAIRNELATGVPTGGRMHSIKGQETLNGLNNWLRRNPDASYYDRLVGQSLADELSLVLRGGG